jgi:hypothetical protein
MALSALCPKHFEATSSSENDVDCYVIIRELLDPDSSIQWEPKWPQEHRLKVFEERVLRRIFRPERDEMIEVWRKLHNEELHNLYSSPNIIRMIKSRRMKWAGM